MEYIMTIVKQLFYVSILSMLLVQLMPQEKYQKMMKTVCGLFMVLIMVRPLLQITGSEKLFQNIYQSITQNIELGEMKQSVVSAQPEVTEVMVQEYEKQVEDNIDSMVMNQGLYPAATKVTICSDEASSQYGCITSVSLTVTTDSSTKNSKIWIEPVSIQKTGQSDKIQQEDEKLVTLSEEITAFYQLDEKAVSIRYQ